MGIFVLPENCTPGLIPSVTPQSGGVLNPTARINVPQEEIENFTEKINQRRSNIMFDFEGLSGYDVQETRRLARQEGWQEAEQKAAQEKKAIADYLRTQGISDELIKNAMSVQPK
ncbi:MAG: hypothetical protein Ta2B_00980 [Termitinemataceae bacterium]|nr:MAG: hypothetical protein Ta2B_00980 [Termitinemataceae bacterium]